MSKTPESLDPLRGHQTKPIGRLKSLNSRTKIFFVDIFARLGTHTLSRGLHALVLLSTSRPMDVVGDHDRTMKTGSKEKVLLLDGSIETLNTETKRGKLRIVQKLSLLSWPYILYVLCWLGIRTLE